MTIAVCKDNDYKCGLNDCCDYLSRCRCYTNLTGPKLPLKFKLKLMITWLEQSEIHLTNEITRKTNCTLDLKGSGNPPCGIPMYPCRNSTTDRGKDSSSALSSTSALVRLFCTMNWAKSPTILEDGVTWERERQKRVNKRANVCRISISPQPEHETYECSSYTQMISQFA